MKVGVVCAGFAVAGSLLLVGCDKSEKPAAQATPAAPAAKLAAAEVTLKDSVENLPNALIAVSYDPAVGQYKGAVDLIEKATADRVAAFKTKVAALPAPKDPSTKPTLSLNYTSIANTTRFAAIALNGSEYVSGTAATPLMQRWVWLPTSKSLLTVEQFVPSGVSAITARGGGGKLIGMEPSADANGRMSSVNFVFAKDGEADAVDKVHFAASELKSFIDPKYRDLLGDDPAK